MAAVVNVMVKRSRRRDPSNAGGDRLPDPGSPQRRPQNPDAERQFKEHGRHLVPVHGNHRSESGNDQCITDRCPSVKSIDGLIGGRGTLGNISQTEINFLCTPVHLVLLVGPRLSR